jgi:hypothetical protein
MKFHHVIALGFVSTVFAACAAHPTTEDFSRNLLRAHCQRVAECNGIASPDVDACVSVMQSLAGSKGKGDSSPDACDVDAANKCIVETRALACDVLDRAPFARSCDGC